MKERIYYLKSWRILCAFAVILMICLSSKAKVRAEEWMELQASANEKYQISIRWHKKSVDKFVIYRQVENKKNRTWSSQQKIARITGNKSTFVDKGVKRNKHYNYSIKAYKGKKLKYYGEIDAWSGIGPCGWSDYFSMEGTISPHAISIECGIYHCMRPDGYKIYRAKSGGKYKLIKTIKNKKYSMKYTDRSVKAGTHYKYKVRAYKKIKGKMIYGPYSEVLNKNAVHQIGRYKAEMLCPEKNIDGSVPYLILKLSPKDAYNGNLSINRFRGGDLLCGDSTVINYFEDDSYPEDDETIQYRAYLTIDAYSLDGMQWTKTNQKSVILPGKNTMYFKLKSQTESIMYTPSEYDGVAFSCFYLGYNDNIPVIMTINLKTGDTSMGYNAEAIH